MKTRLYILWMLCLLLSAGVRAQELGPSAYSTLAWNHISTVFNRGSVSNSIGLTTDKRMYVWGDNKLYTIHTNYTTNGANFSPLKQTAPFYLRSPAGETIKKVQVKFTLSDAGTEAAPTYFALSESGKLYAWGFNNGLLASAWPVPSGSPTLTLSDTTRHRRTPTQLTILGESEFVDFDASTYNNFWISIGASGKAYHIGEANSSTGLPIYTYAALPNPAGVNAATFKYTRVWVNKEVNPYVYLKGNNGKMYFTGPNNSAFATGVPAIYARNSPAPTFTSDESRGSIRIITPREVPSLEGMDVVKMEIGYPINDRQTTYALTSTGKLYMTGLWRVMTYPNDPLDLRNYVVVPLKTAPLSTEVDNFYRTATADTVNVLKTFVEVALPPGATKILDIMSHERYQANGGPHGSSVVGDNNKVYWSGTLWGIPNFGEVYASNYLSLSENKSALIYQQNYDCSDASASATRSRFSWIEESINLEGAAQLFTAGGVTQRGQVGIISKTGRGYFVGNLDANAGVAKTSYSNNSDFYPSLYPVPIANEQLLSCQTSPGTGGPLVPVTPTTNTAVGTIDCSKTQIAPAPVAGAPSQSTLIVSINVTTAGTFTPITVSGSGMSLGNSVTSVSTTTTGIQTFYIPIQYDGSALTNAFTFTVGSAGSCTADLTQKSNKQVTNVWSLNNCSAVTPGVLSK
jgi:hypothetical protein